MTVKACHPSPPDKRYHQIKTYMETICRTHRGSRNMLNCLERFTKSQSAEGSLKNSTNTWYPSISELTIDDISKIDHHLTTTYNNPDSKVHGANMGPTWVLSSPGGPHVGPMNLAIWESMNRVDMYVASRTCGHQGVGSYNEHRGIVWLPWLLLYHSQAWIGSWQAL